MCLPQSNPKDALQKAVNIAGGQTELAKIINTRQQNVWTWLNRDKKCSATYVAKVSEVTGVPCYELRPDIFPAPANDAVIQPKQA